MNIPEFITSLSQHGITVEADQGNLKVNAPKGVLSLELQNQLREWKSEIIDYLLNKQANSLSKPTIPRADRSRPIPAPSSQRGLWFQYRLEGMSDTYNLPVTYHLKGQLDILALERSLQNLISRHDSLRMCFEAIDGEPYLIIADQVVWNLDVRQRDGADIQQELTQVASQPFQLEQAPLFRAHLWTDSGSNHTLLLNFHHIISDGWSQGIFQQELSSLYNGIVSGVHVELPPLELNYSDYAVWQSDWLKSAEFENKLACWKAALQGAPELLELPYDHPRPAVQNFRGGHIGVDMEPDFADQLRALARREKITLFMLLNAGYAILLGRYSHQDNVVIGIPMANRAYKELESMVGFFVNTLPVRVNLMGNPTLPEFLRHMRSLALDAFAHQALPFDQLVNALMPHREAGYNPIFQAVFDFVNIPSQDLRLGDCEIQPGAAAIDASKFDLTLWVIEPNRGLRFSMEYNADLFEAATAHRMLAHYVRILEWMVSNPSSRIGDFSLLSQAERKQILEDWNTITDYPRQKCVHQVFEEQADNTPFAPALTFSGQTITYRELNERANQLSRSLVALGVGVETRICIYIERTVEMVVALLAILKAGGVYAPLDPSYPEERLFFILNDTQAPILLTLKRHLPDLPVAASKLVCVDDESLYTGQSKENLTIPVSAENLAYVMYTSGSTGSPKGSCIPHRGIVRLVKNINYADLSSSEVFLLFAPLAFDASTFEIWGSLLNGAKLAIFPPNLPSLGELTHFVKDNSVTTMFLTSGLFHQVMEWHPEIVDGLHQFLSGGDVLSPRHVRMVLEKNPACRFINVYGPTENTTFTCCYTVKGLKDIEDNVSIGCPIANTSVYILDEYQNPVPVGVLGELYTGGDGLAREYLNQPDVTMQKFIPDPFHPEFGQRLYRTGDYARWHADGNIEFAGRMDHQVKLRGFRIELSEIENVLKQYPGINDAVVLMREDQPGNKQLVGYIVSEKEIGKTEIRAYLEDKLPKYMIPATHVMLRALPLTANGKVDRKALPLPTYEHLSDDIQEPITELETRLVRIWSQLLGVNSVSTDSDFFDDLGGNSLLAVRLMSMIEHEMNLRLPVIDLFRASTIRELAQLIQAKQAKPADWTPLVPVQPKGTGRPLFIIHSPAAAMNLARELGTKWPIFGLEASGLEEGTEPDVTIEQMADRYLEAIKSVQDSGPYRLMGYCTGGVVAYEIARKLEQLDQKVSLLVELDGYAVHNRVHSWYHWLDIVRESLPFLFKRYTSLGLSKSIERMRMMFKKVLLGRREIAGVGLERASEFEIEHGINTESTYAEKLQWHIDMLGKAQLQYRAQPYSGRVTVFAAKWRYPHELFFQPMDPTLGWGQLAQGGVDSYFFKGEHDDYYRPPYVNVMAVTLKGILESLDINEPI